MPPKLLKHQREGIDFLRAHPRAALFDEPGLGKSRTALEAATEPILVLAPAMLLDGGVWADEAALWRPGADITVVPYSQLSERVKGPKGGSKPTGRLRTDLRRKWGTVILDEAHYVKGRKTNWTLAAKQLQTDSLFLLTGTPLPNWAHEAFTLLQLLYPEEAKPGRWLGSYWRWVEEWFKLGEQYGKGGVVVSDHVIGDMLKERTWEEFIAENWRDRMLLRLREDCLDLPPMTEQTIRVDMVPVQKKAYKELKKDFITWLESGAEVAAWSSASQLVKLAQCATGLEVLDQTAHGSGKLDVLEDLLADRPFPTLVVAHFRRSVLASAQRASALGRRVAIITGESGKTSRAMSVRAFQAGKIDVLCATIDTISEGLTLNAADQVIRVERSWRPSRNEQVIRRIHRIGQTRPVSVIDLVTRGTADERVLELLALKTDSQMKALGRTELKELV